MAEEGTSLFFSVLLSLLLPLLLFTIFKQFNPSLKSPPLPPGPYQWPILGNILHMGNKPHISLTHFAQSYGPLISLRLGTQILIVGSSPGAASEILKTNDRVLSGRFVPHSLNVKKPKLNALSLMWTFECSDRWKYLRTVCRSELFSNKVLESQSGLRERKAVEMAEFLGEMEGKVVRVGDVAFDTLFNMLSNVLMSRDFISMADEDEEGEMRALVRALSEVATAPNLADFYSIFDGLDLQNIQKKGKIMMVRICSMWEGIIKERREQKDDDDISRQGDFLDVLFANNFTDDQINQLFLVRSLKNTNILKLMENNKCPEFNSGYNWEQLVDVSSSLKLSKCLITSDIIESLVTRHISIGPQIELFMAGTDTTSSTIEWAMAELIRNPESMNKAREELAKEIVNNQYDSIKESNLPKLPYLQACIKETLRLHPPVPLLLPHRAVESCTVMNYTIPKNSQVMVNVWAIGRDPKNWEEPITFKPERFLHNSNLDYKGNNFEFIPFSAGRKICPGIPMAAKEAPLILAFLFHFFDWSLPNGLDPKELEMSDKFGVTLQKEQPLLLIPKRRK